MEEKKRVLFLCTGNSTRSQMAEGFARQQGSGVLEAFSAGVAPSALNPMAVKGMEEKGIDISGHRSNTVNEELLKWADLLVTLCSSADENCPVLPPGVEKRHWPLPDPTEAEGTEEDVLNEHRKVRDQIEERVRELVEEIKAEGS